MLCAHASAVERVAGEMKKRGLCPKEGDFAVHGPKKAWDFWVFFHNAGFRLTIHFSMESVQAPSCRFKRACSALCVRIRPMSKETEGWLDLRFDPDDGHVIPEIGDIGSHNYPEWLRPFDDLKARLARKSIGIAVFEELLFDQLASLLA